MTMIDDSTEPKRGAIFPPVPDEPEEEDDDNGPGCLVWSVVGVFGFLLALAIVATAGLAGFNNGLNGARSTATAERRANIAEQCTQLQDDILAGRASLAERRIEDLTQGGIVPACAEPLIAQATQYAIINMSTPTATPTTEPTPLPTATESIAEVEVTAVPTSDSGYDLVALLNEARTFMNSGDYAQAILTLDAIVAIDPNYETSTVTGLLFNALTARARNLYTGGGSLTEAIMLTNRAETYGSLVNNDLLFERAVAQYYVDAQPFMNLNYGEAIRLLQQVRSLSANYRNTNQLLFAQYIAYGDAFVAGLEPCRAVPQYEAGLQIFENAEALSKRDTAQQQCQAGVIPVTIDPNATPDPNATATFAPVGQQ